MAGVQGRIRREVSGKRVRNFRYQGHCQTEFKRHGMKTKDMSVNDLFCVFPNSSFLLQCAFLKETER